MSKLYKARENTSHQVAIGFSLAADWLKERRKVFWTNHIAKYSKTNAMTDYFRLLIGNCTMRKIASCFTICL